MPMKPYVNVKTVKANTAHHQILIVLLRPKMSFLKKKRKLNFTLHIAAHSSTQ